MTPSQLADIIAAAYPDCALEVALEIVRCLHQKAVGAKVGSLVRIQPQAQTTESPRAVMVAVCDHFGYTQAELKGRAKGQRITHARKVCWALMRDRLRCSLTEVGQLFGRDHTTIRISHQLPRDHQDYAAIAARLDAARKLLDVGEAISYAQPVAAE